MKPSGGVDTIGAVDPMVLLELLMEVAGAGG